MSIESRIKAALEPIVPVVVPNVYTGDSLTYIVFNYSEIPQSITETGPVGVRATLQIHLYIPSGTSPLSAKNQIREALFAAGATYPSITNASDGDGQHYVFECEMLE